MKVRIHATNKKSDVGGKRECPQCISQIFDTDNVQDKDLAEEKIKEYEAMGGKLVEMLVEAVPIGEIPSWEK